MSTVENSAAATPSSASSASTNTSTTNNGATPAATAGAAGRSAGGGTRRTAEFLGYFSVGLGLAELLVPRAMQRVIGVARPAGGSAATMQVFGAREIGAGVAILGSTNPAPAVWARVAGDALDIAVLGVTLANNKNQRGRTLFALGNVLAITALDVITARRLS